MSYPTAEAGPSRRPSGPNRALPPLPISSSGPSAPPPSAAAQLNARFQSYANRSHTALTPSPHAELFASPIWSSHDDGFSSETTELLPHMPPRRSPDVQQWTSFLSSPPRPPPPAQPWIASPQSLYPSSPPPPSRTVPPPPPPPPPLPPPSLPSPPSRAQDPWSQQEEYDQRAAAAAAAAAPAGAPSSTPASARSAVSPLQHPSSWELEQADRLEAVRLSLEDVQLEQERRTREAGRWPSGSGRSGGGHTGAGQDRTPRRDESRESGSFYHTPPLQDSKPSPRLPDTNRPPSPPSFFETEFRAHADIVGRLKQWQAGTLSPGLEWHELVPEGVRLGMDKGTVERQGLLWEIFRSEQEYVKNLEGGLNGFYTPLATAPPHVLTPEARETFLQDTFYNINWIFPKHSRMVYRLQERQLETHPVVHSISDVLIDSLLDLLGPYEIYLKHYPYAEARLRKELSANRPFNDFVSHLSHSPVVRKQDLASFLVSPLSRLSKLELALDRLRKITPASHDDATQLPVVLDQIRGMLRAVQPGVDAANAKVKAWQVARKLRFRKGERNDLNLDLESNERALLLKGKIWRRFRNERDWHGWTELCLILFDNYLLITKEETKPGGQPDVDDDLIYSVVSRPIPLEFLSIVGSEHDPGEHRRDMIVDYQRRKPFRVSSLLEPILQPDREIYPFHLEHRGLRKGYSLYVESEAGRRDWLDRIKDQITVRRVVLENNALFSVSPLSYRPPKRGRAGAYQRPPAVSRMTEAAPGHVSPGATTASSSGSASPLVHHHSVSGSFASTPSLQRTTTQTMVAGHGSVSIAAAASFQRFDKEMFMVADSDGLSIGYRDDSRSHRLVIESSSITDICLLDIDRLLVLATSTLYSVELKDLLPSPDPDEWPRVRKEQGETVSAWGESVTGFCAGRRDGRLLVIYWVTNRLSGQSAIEVYEPLLKSNATQRSLSIGSISSLVHRRTNSSGSATNKKPPPGYRHLASGSALGAIHSITFFDALVCIAVDKGFIISDPLSLSTNTPNAPVFPDTAQSKTIHTTLRSRVSSYQPLLMYRIDEDCFICVYETGCFWVDRRGVVAKGGAYITWETRATAAAVRGRSLILFSKDRRFVAVHDVWFGSLRQVTEGQYRLVGDGAGRNVLAVLNDGQLVELLETVALPLRVSP